MAKAHINVSVVDTQPFRRLVEFMADIERYAEDHEDDHLQALVNECRDDLLGLRE